MSTKDKDIFLKNLVAASKLKRVLKSVDTTAAQKEMWSTINFTETADTAYNLTVKVELEGVLDIRALKLAFRDLFLRYTILNCIISKDGEKMLFIDGLTPSLNIFNLDLYSVDEFAHKEVTNSFDLTAGPLVRSSLLKGQDKSILFFTVHHIICDGWSLEVVIQDLSRLYSQRKTGVVQLETSPIQFYNYMQIRDFDSIKKYWIEKLDGFNHQFSIPTEYSRPNMRTFESKRFDFDFSTEFSADLRRLAQKNGFSFYSSLLAVYGTLLHKISKADDLIIGIPAAEQSVSGHHNLVGHYVNLIPMRIVFDKKLNFIDLLNQVKKTLLDGLDFQQVTFGELLQVIDVPRVAGQVPLINNIFNLDIQKKNQGLAFDGLQGHFRTVPRMAENFELFLNIVTFGDDLIFEMQFNTNLFSQETIHKWMRSFEGLVSIILKNPSTPLSSIVLDLPAIEPMTLKTPKTPDRAKEKNISVPKKETLNIEKTEDFDVAKLWSEVLLIDNIPKDMNFFALGGHSLLAIKMVSRLKEAGYQIGLNDIFRYPTILELETLLNGQKGESGVKQIEVVHTKKSSHSLSKSQLRSLFLSLKSSVAVNNLPTGLNLGEGIDHEKLKLSVHQFLNCHPLLLSKLFINGGGDYEFRGPYPFDKDISVEKLSNKDIQSYIELQFTQKLDLLESYLFKTKIFINEFNETILFFMPHHLVWDGWCFDLLINELDSNYRSLLDGTSFKTSLDKFTYSDYIDYSNNLLESRSYAKSLNYWHEKLSGKLPILDLPIDFPRPRKASNLASSVFIEFSAQDVKNLNTVSERLGVSTFNTLLSLFKIVLSKYARQDDLVVGLPVRNRHSEKFENTVGYFVNSIAIRTELSKEMELQNFIKNVASACFQGFDNEQVIFEDVVKLLGIGQDTSRSPVFQSFFTFQEVSNRSSTFDSNPISHVKRKTNTTHTDLDLWVKASQDKIEGAFVYRVDLFSEITITRIKESFELLVKSILNLLDSPLGVIDVVTDDQKFMLENSWNATVCENESLTVSELFEKSCLQFPDNTAIYCEKKSFTYSEVLNLSDRYASSLINRGVKPGDLVGLCVDRESQMLIALLGIMKAGAGYIPLEPSFPKDRIDYMVETSDLNIIIASSKYKERFSKSLTVVDLSELTENESLNRCEFPKVDLDALMYVIYTSGSTGLPKGVELTHRSVSNFLQSMVKTPGLKSSTSLLAVTTLSFDIAVLELYAPLLVGGSVFIASKAQTINGDSLKTIISDKEITAMQATPSTWRLLLASGWQAKEGFKVLCGGEPFPLDLAETLLEQTQDVWNMYGPTETTVWSTCKKIKKDDKKMLIGKPIDNTQVYILDERGQSVPIGATGELFIAGEGLAKGYRKRDDLTQKVFSFNERLKTRVYNTGDLARWNYNGDLECLGRNDGQVKVRGYRIELGEIEAQIAKSPGVTSCVVITREDIPGDVRLVAYIIGDFNHLELRKFLSVSLPVYMIPSNFIKLDSFPKTLNDKIDKKNLPSPLSLLSGGQKPSTKLERVEPKTETERAVKDLWVSVLAKNDFGIQDNFFDIGGHSILSVTLFSKIENKFDIQLELSMLFDYPTIFLISELIDLKLKAKKISSTSDKNLGDSRASTCVVKIRDGNDGIPLFMFHGVGGNVLNYRDLGLKVAANKAVYGLQASGVDGISELHQSIKEMAVHYAKEIVNTVDSKKVFLAGGSMGGLLALEVAIELKKIDVEVGKLIMFDTSGPNLQFKPYITLKKRFERLKDSLFYRISSFFKEKEIAKYEKTGRIIPHHLRYYKIEKNNFKCMKEHVVSSYDGDMVLFRAPLTQKGFYSDSLLGWGGVIKGDIKIVTFDVPHATFVESAKVQDSFIEEISKP